ncbi:hypothetical protein JMN32_05840 [Fulvivirga sp. 29W222]|uniref:Uncharacterized protein n=1 Tax=Fulvivirga marina TaxID=2494733 RepID=A0A937KD33_9BACT|nr:hypothetical protein [Fulvivirga marina]MBL6445818.1 hypothetical protein [Fulvivirga marina]
MEEPLFIGKEEELKQGEDFDFLRAEGIKYIQELTGSYWTDYNEHDPGVTILEQLCYALTDLSFRTDFKIEDHLFDDKNRDHSFLNPNEILPCNPLTINDYRKLVFDSVFEISNVWIQPIGPVENSINGLYKILLDLDEGVKDKNIRNNVVAKTKEVFCDNRNICEDIEEVKILEPVYVTIHADVEVDGMHDIESILAQIFFKADEYLSPEIRFYSLKELLDEGLQLDEIFNGPLLKHGFIKSEELYPKPDKILISEITKIIMQVSGVVSVKNLYLKIGDEIFENQLNIEEHQIARLVTDFEDKPPKHPIQFMRGVVNYSSMDGKVVKRKLNEMKSATKRVYRLSEGDIHLDKGKELHIEDYYSLQNQFPVNYGIGEYGIPNSPSTLRRAQAKQLKGFLLIFEQIIANYLSQLAHAKDLFSVRKNVEHTYFYQPLDNVPDVEPLYKDETGVVDDPLLKEYNLPANYKKGLGELVQLNDNFIDRRNRFLDYLLAVHGESFSQYSYSQFNHYFDDKEFELHLIQSKVRLLKSLDTLNKNRARAFNYRKKSIDTANITGMEARIAILMGLGVSGANDVNEYHAHSLLNHYSERGLQLKSENSNKSEIKSWTSKGSLKSAKIETDYVTRYFDYVDEEEINLSDYEEGYKQGLIKETLPFKSKTMLTDFLREGMDLINFRIGKGKDSGEYHVVFNKPSTEEWLVIASSKTYEDALVSVLELVNTLKKLNMQSEGLHMVEHTLLRPEVIDKRFGIYLLDAERKSFFRSTGLYTFKDREKAIEALRPEIKKYENYSVERREDGDFEVHFKTSDGKIHLVSLAFRASVEKTHEKMEMLYRHLSDTDDIVPFEHKIGLYVQYAEGSIRIPEEFYSFRVSVVFPSWTNRFSDDEFRSIIEDTVNMHSPANVASSIFWFDPEDMETFEKLYYSWMEEKMNENGTKGDGKFRAGLSEYLFKLYGIES